MKHIQLLLSVLALIFIASCRSDDSELKKEIPADLIGTWVMQGHGEGRFHTYSFNNDNTGSYTYTGVTTYFSFPYTYNVSGKSIYIKGVYVDDMGDTLPDWHVEGTFISGVLIIEGEQLTKQ